MSIRSIARQCVLRSQVAVGMDVRAIGRMRQAVAAQEQAVVQVVNLHGTLGEDEQRFRKQLEWLKRHFELIDFQTFARGWQEPQTLTKTGRPGALLTFDDGLASNYHVAAPILEEAGTRGVFFVVPRFSACSGDEAKRYYFEWIRPGDSGEGVADEMWQPMSAAQIGELAKRGHTIGNHTLSHVRLSEVTNQQARQEIEEGAKIVGSWINGPVEAFAWPFAWDAITKESWRVACQHHPYCFAPCPGTTDLMKDSPQLIWRTNVETNYKPYEYRFMYAGLADGLWRAKRQRLCQMLTGKGEKGLV